MKTLTITRNKGFYGKFRKLRLCADDQEVGRISDGQTITVAVPPDAQTIVGRMDWGKTYSLDLQTVKDGGTLEITSWFTMNPLRQFGIMRLPARFEKTGGKT